MNHKFICILIASSVKHSVYVATLVAQGSDVGVVISTGDFTQIGNINHLVNSTEHVKTDVLRQIDIISKWLFIIICTLTLSTFLIAFFYFDTFSGRVLDSIVIALICAVAMVPEGLEAIVILKFPYAVKVMASQNAIVRALPAVETLGSVTVICSDKTGTLTQNIMSLTAFVTSNAHFKNNVHASDRVSVNFVRDDSYLAERASLSIGKSGDRIWADGPNSGERSATKASTDFPFKNGDSPTKAWIQAALSCDVLCSKCVFGEGGGRAGEIGNPTELSILRTSYFSGIDIEELKRDCPMIAEVPFSSEYKFMATVHEPTALDTAPADKYLMSRVLLI